MKTPAPQPPPDLGNSLALGIHGQRLAKGDTKVATCASCHAAHGIRAVSDAKSPVFSLNVARTCASCHANVDHMKGYTTDGGAPLPTDQFAAYQKSVHYEALTKRNDLSAPTCNDCHGNHGAAPPEPQLGELRLALPIHEFDNLVRFRQDRLHGGDLRAVELGPGERELVAGLPERQLLLAHFHPIVANARDQPIGVPDSGFQPVEAVVKARRGFQTLVALAVARRAHARRARHEHVVAR